MIAEAGKGLGVGGTPQGTILSDGKGLVHRALRDKRSKFHRDVVVNIFKGTKKTGSFFLFPGDPILHFLLWVGRGGVQDES